MTPTPSHVATDELIETLERLEKEATPGPIGHTEGNIWVVREAPERRIDCCGRFDGRGDCCGNYITTEEGAPFQDLIGGLRSGDAGLYIAMRNHLPALISALKENKRLREALSDATEAIIMMSGSSDFASDGQAGAWWTKFRDEKFYPAILFLTTTAALQPQGDAKP